MKIACIGNMNNILAPAAQYLSDLGHAVDLFLLYEYDHFAPEADYSNKEDIQFKIKKIGMEFGNIFSISKKEIKGSLLGYDYYIGTDYAPALLARIGLKIDMFAWAGTDLFDWPFYQSAYHLPQLWEIDLIRTAKHQWHGIRQARILPMSVNNDFIIQALNKIGYHNRIIPPLPFMYYPEAEKNLSGDNEFTRSMRKDRDEGRLVFVQQSRQWWKSAPAFISKGNDIFFKGLNIFKKQNPNTRFRVYLFEYGADVDASKELIAELGLVAEVAWLPMMKRKELLSVLGHADIGVGQFGSESWYLFCSNAEIIFAGAAYLGFRDDTFCTQNACELYPMLNANTPDAIADQIQTFVKDKGAHISRNMAAKNWLLAYNKNEFIANISEELKEKRSNQLSWNSQMAIILANFGLFLSKKIGQWVLYSRIPWLKRNVIEWAKS